MNCNSSKCAAETAAFLNGSSSPENVSWPQKRSHASRTNGVGVRLLILGSLVFDVQVALRACWTDLANAITQGAEKFRCDWSVRARVGGFAAWAARAARQAGAQIWLSGVVPVPIPELFEQFFADVDADTSHLRVFPGRVPASIELFAGGQHLLIARSGVQTDTIPHIPNTVFDDFDAVVVNPGPAPMRLNILQSLRSAKNNGHCVPVAICARPDWSDAELSLVRDTGWLVFLNGEEAITAARRITGNGVSLRNGCLLTLS